MFLPKINVLAVLLFLIVRARCQEYDFGAEISRQCLVPDPVGLLDCVENRVTLPYLKSWVDCTNSLGENVQTSADIINYRCKSVWEGKGVIPEVFYIKDCVIEKTGLPPKNVSAEVLGAYKECEKSPTPPGQISSRTKSAPLQQQQVAVAPPQQVSTVKTATLPIPAAPAVQPITVVGAAQPQQQQYAAIRSNGVPQMPMRQPISQQYFIMYPMAPMPIQQSLRTSSVTYQQNPSNQPLSQQQVPISSAAFSSPRPSAATVSNQQTIKTQQQPASFVSQQQVPMQSYAPQTLQPTQNFPMFGSIPNGAYYYGFEIHHPQKQI
ncbi:TSC22 domain family protein 1-like [Parasteatoda tepidariorum]|uniref:TSC22 domain family protein 1-like n=1 Tax=Parasteatoda tepidariorum TaxID=114398 RepID=UPI001C7183F5|nr:TSC22 domain family protein 1-like [Parasteatoda tepidariorum]